MIAVAELPRRVDPVVMARTRAVNNLDLALRKPEEAVLREHQVNMLSALRDFFASGERAGYLSEPTGVGKSAVMVKAAETMGLRTVILSPTLQILTQNHREAQRFTPDLSISNYSSREKDLSGKVLNTTYQSVYNLVQDKDSGFDPEKVQLVLCDEAHVGLGLKRHEIYRFFPNALLVGLTATPDFTPLDGLIDRGIVKEDEFWTGLFRNQIHEMTLEEAMERGILVGVDVHMLRTNTVVDNLVISQGDYRPSDVERFFATKSRSALAIGMVAGLDKLPKDVEISSDQAREIKAIHDKIQGKRTVIFGISIAHTEELAKQLRKAGISAAAVHGEMDPSNRARILDSHTKGKIQVVLGVDLLRLGWDSPATEVSIHLKPTASGVKKVQELGRVLRPSPETGKENAIAIELVDEVRKKIQQPVLIAHCFDPEYVLRGTRTGLEKERESVPQTRSKKPKLSFSGINISAVVEEARSQEMLRRRFKQASVVEISDLFDELMKDSLGKESDLGLRGLFERISDSLPGRTPLEANLIALQAIGSLDNNTRKLGIKALLLLNMKTVLTVLRSFEGAGLISEGESDDVFAESLMFLTEKLGRIKPHLQIAQQINGLIKGGIAAYIAKRDSLPVTFVKRSDLPLILEEINGVLEKYGGIIPKGKIDEITSWLSEKTGTNPRTLKRILERINQPFYLSAMPKSEKAPDDTQDAAINRVLRESIEDVLQDLTTRERRVLELRFGLGEGEAAPLDLNAVGREFNITRERVRQIEAKALRKLRHPTMIRRLTSPMGIFTYLPSQTVPFVDGYMDRRRLVPRYSAGEIFGTFAEDLDLKAEFIRDEAIWTLKKTEYLYKACSEGLELFGVSEIDALLFITDKILERYKGSTAPFYLDKTERSVINRRLENQKDPAISQTELRARQKMFAAAYEELLELLTRPEPKKV